MTTFEKVVVTAYTGYSMLQGDELDEFYKYLKTLFGHAIYTHEIPKLTDEIQRRSKKDFVEICRRRADG